MVLVFKDTILTNKGFDVSNQAALGQTQFSIFKAVSTDQDLTNYKIEDLKNLTSLPGEIDSGTITDSDNPQNSISVINLTFDNSEFKQGYTIRAIGLYGKDSNGDVFLHSLTVSDTPVVVPEVSGNIFDGVKHSISIFSGNNKNMSVNIQESGSATVKYVNDSISKISDTIKNDIQPKLDAKADNATVTEGMNNLSNENKQGFEGLGGMLKSLLDVDEIKRDVSNRFVDYKNGLNGKQNDVGLTNDGKHLYYNGTPVLIANAPNQPQLDLFINQDNGNLAFKITPPALNGGADITSYNVYYKISTDDEWKIRQLDSNVLYTEVSNLEKAQVYQGKVVANNYSGKSIDSEVKNVITAKEPSGIKLTINPVIYGTNCVVNVSNDGGMKISKYVIYYKKSDENNWTIYESNSSTVTLNELNEGQSYDIKASVVNYMGSSEDSEVVKCIPDYIIKGVDIHPHNGTTDGTLNGIDLSFPNYINKIKFYFIQMNYNISLNSLDDINKIANNKLTNYNLLHPYILGHETSYISESGWDRQGKSGNHRVYGVLFQLDDKGNMTQYHSNIIEL